MSLFRRLSPVPKNRSTHVGVGEGLPQGRGPGLPPPDSGAPGPAERVAVIVVHGIGQQAPFETLEMVAEALRSAEARAHGMAPPLTVRIARVRGRELPRAEVRVTTAQGRPRDVHLYECYWAPLTEGKVTTGEAVRFLLDSGVRGMRLCGFLKWSFDRYLFDRPITFQIPKVAFFQFLGVVAVLLSLVAINAMMVGLLTAKTLARGIVGPPADALVADLTVDLARGLIGIFGGVLLATWIPRLLRRRQAPAPAAGPRVIPAWAAWLAWGFMLAAFAGIVLTALAMLAHGWAHLRGEAARLAQGPIADLFPLRGRWGLIPCLVAAATWLGAAVVNLGVRRFLLQYAGDVAAYVSAHTVSKFSEVRAAIQARALEVFDAVYHARDDAGRGFAYPDVVVAGHSLGSLVAYDALDQLLVREGAEAPAAPAPGADLPGVADRTRMFLTFGSPLDKTAFIFRAQHLRPAGAREALAAARQPMILDYRLRPERWVNLRSPHDWISGTLEYYDDRDQVESRRKWVENRTDPEAVTPLAAHNEYWQGRMLADTLHEAVGG